MLADYDAITGGVAAFRSLPAAAMASGDCYEVELSRGHVQKWACFGSAAGMTMTAPSGEFPGFAVTTVAAGSACYPAFSGLSMAGGKGYFMYCSAGDHFTDVIVSCGWLAANGATGYQVPNLTGLAGWQVAWSIPGRRRDHRPGRRVPRRQRAGGDLRGPPFQPDVRSAGGGRMGKHDLERLSENAPGGEERLEFPPRG